MTTFSFLTLTFEDSPFSSLTLSISSPPFKRLSTASIFAVIDLPSSSESSERMSAPSLSIVKFDALRFLFDFAFVEDEVEGGAL